MIENLNSILVTLHKLLFPYKEILFYLSLVYSIVIAFYYKLINPKELIQKKKIKNAFFYTGFATVMLFYSMLLNYQTPSFLSNLYIFIPLCTLLPTGMLIGSLWLSFYFNSKNKKYDKYKS
jgi:hypothetical protein